jgi:hypothetical protein
MPISFEFISVLSQLFATQIAGLMAVPAFPFEWQNAEIEGRWTVVPKLAVTVNLPVSS